MFNKKNKAKNSVVNKTTAERLADLKKNGEWVKKMKFVKETFYPSVIKASASIDDALQLLHIVNTVIMEKFLARMKTVTMRDLDVYTNLMKSDPKYEDIKAMLGLFDEMSAFEAKEYIEGLKAEISLFINEEQKVRSLSTLPTKWMSDL